MPAPDCRSAGRIRIAQLSLCMRPGSLTDGHAAVPWFAPAIGLGVLIQDGVAVVGAGPVCIGSRPARLRTDSSSASCGAPHKADHEMLNAVSGDLCFRPNQRRTEPLISAVSTASE